MSNKQDKGTLSSLLKASGTKTAVPVIQIVRQKNLATAISKSVSPDTPSRFTPAGTREAYTPSQQMLMQISNQTAENISQSDTILQMIPDTELGAQILISAITCPKDMMTIELTYSVGPGLLPPNVVSSMTAIIRKNFENVYKIKSKLPTILRDMLFDKGSHVIGIIPENSIDELINRSNSISLETYHEAISSQYGGKHGLASTVGLLGPSDFENANVKKRVCLGDTTFNVGLESLSLDAYSTVKVPHKQSLQLGIPNGAGNELLEISDVVITDNPNILRGPMIENKIRQDTLKKTLGFNRVGAALESFDNRGVKLDDRSLMAAIYKSRKTQVNTIQVMKTDNQLSRRTLGRPLEIVFPPESVIPVFCPGQEDKHVGYYILLDQTGNPVKTSTESDLMSSMTRRINTATNQTNNVVNRLRQLTEGFGCTNDQEYANTMVRVYSDIVEADLLARLRNGVYANGVALAKNPEYYRVMLSRVLAQQRTTVLFMPAEMMVYFARRFNKYGVGVSILDDMRVLNNVRAITMLGNTLLGIRNSVPHTKVDLTVDETDPDPYKTAEMFMGEIMRVNNNAIPLAASTPVDMLDYFQRARYQINIKGHPGIPDTSAEYSESNTGYQRVDTDLEKDLQDRAMMTMGLNSEIVNNGFNGSETATSVVANNLMLSRRVVVLQEIINPILSDYHRKIINADEEILKELRETLESNYKQLGIDEQQVSKEMGLTHATNIKQLIIDQLVSEFVSNLEVTLPRPEAASTKAQKEALDEYQQLLKVAINAYLSSEFFTEEIAGKVSTTVESIRAYLEAYFTRKFMAENGIMPELAAIVSNDVDDASFDLWEAQKDHMDAIVRSLGKFMRDVHEVKKEESVQNAILERDLEEAVNNLPEGGGTTTTTSDDSSGSDAGGGDDEFGFGDLDLSADGPADEDPAPGGGEGGGDLPAEPEVS